MVTRSVFFPKPMDATLRPSHVSSYLALLPKILHTRCQLLVKGLQNFISLVVAHGTLN